MQVHYFSLNHGKAISWAPGAILPFANKSDLLSIDGQARGFPSQWLWLLDTGHYEQQSALKKFVNLMWKIIQSCPSDWHLPIWLLEGEPRRGDSAGLSEAETDLRINLRRKFGLCDILILIPSKAPLTDLTHLPHLKSDLWILFPISIVFCPLESGVILDLSNVFML